MWSADRGRLMRSRCGSKSTLGSLPRRCTAAAFSWLDSLPLLVCGFTMRVSRTTSLSMPSWPYRPPTPTGKPS
eukprot:3596972-Pyramimonas_sp.AAC.1